MHASNGILFNHESPVRGETFVTRKITRAAARIRLGLQEKLYIGNLNAKRDWGYAGDYVELMWRILQQPEPDDYVIATGITTTVRDFVSMAFRRAGVEIDWEGEGIEEKGFDRKSKKIVVEVDPRYFRPAEVDLLIGDPSKAGEKLGWKPKVTLEELVNMMVSSDLKDAEQELHLRKNGFEVKEHHE
jgi:GDPmannose 4,6-dehydratase